MASAPITPAVELLQRIQCEFLEMPGLRLTEPQARRLWNLDSLACADVLRVLLESGFLFRTPDGAFMRVERATAVTIDVARASSARSKLPAA